MHKRYLFIYFFISLLFFLNAVLADEERPVSEEYQRIYNALTTLEADPEQVAEIKNVTLRRDEGTFLLKEGKLALLKPIDGRIHVAGFVGIGSFRMTPPTQVEREHLARFTDEESVNQKLKTAFFFFADETASELQQKLSFTKSRLPRNAQKEVDYALKYLWQNKKKRFDYLFLRTLLNEPENGLFYAHFAERQFKPWFFEINPYEDEEVRFSRRRKGASFLHLREIINQFHLASEYRQPKIIYQNKSTLHITHFDIDVVLKGSRLDFSAKTTIDFHMLEANQNWLNVFLYYKLEVDSVFWDNGQPAEFVKNKDNAMVWIKADSLMPKETARSLTFHYQGDLIERQKDWFYIQSSKGWYPLHDFQQRSTFDAIYDKN